MGRSLPRCLSSHLNVAGGAERQRPPIVERQSVLPGAVKSRVADVADVWLYLAPESARRDDSIKHRIGDFFEVQRYGHAREDENRAQPATARQQREAHRKKGEGNPRLADDAEENRACPG